MSIVMESRWVFCKRNSSFLEKRPYVLNQLFDLIELLDMSQAVLNGFRHEERWDVVTHVSNCFFRFSFIFPATQ